MLRFDKKSFFIASIIFIIEVIIALYIKDKIIRPFVGDILVVIFIYYFIKAFINIKPLYIAIFTLLFSFVVEILQYFNFITLIGLEHNKAAKIILRNEEMSTTTFNREEFEKKKNCGSKQDNRLCEHCVQVVKDVKISPICSHK